MGMINTSIFKQMVFENKYSLGYRGCYVDMHKGELLERKEIYRCDIPMPMLRVGDKFYIEGRDLIVTITQVVRTSEDNVLYFIMDDIIDTEKSLKQKEELEKIANANKIIVDENERVINIYYRKNSLYRFFIPFDKFKKRYTQNPLTIKG